VSSVETKDREWIPEVTQRGWLIITRDSGIQERRREIAAVRKHGARMVALVGRDARSTFDQFEVVMSQWRRILRCLDEAGPFIYAATRTTFRRVALT
jgi:hypothetical protein